MSAAASAGSVAGRSEVARLLARFGVAASYALSYGGLTAARAMVAAGELAEYPQGLGSIFKRLPPQF